MKRLALLLLVLASSCLTDADVNQALAGYCESPSATTLCEADTECCPGFACLGRCVELPPNGGCLLPAVDGGTQGRAAGARCGCDSDCRNNQCLDGECL